MNRFKLSAIDTNDYRYYDLNSINGQNTKVTSARVTIENGKNMVVNESMGNMPFGQFIEYYLIKRAMNGIISTLNLESKTNYGYLSSNIVSNGDSVSLKKNALIYYKGYYYFIKDEKSIAKVKVDRDDCGLKIISWPSYYGKDSTVLDDLLDTINKRMNIMYIGDPAISVGIDSRDRQLNVSDYLLSYGFEKLAKYKNANYKTNRVILIRKTNA